MPAVCQPSALASSGAVQHDFSWPFSTREIDIIGKVTPEALNGYEFTMLDIDFFTK